MAKLNNIIDTILKYLYYSLFFFTPLIMAPYTSELFEFNKLIFIYFITLGVIFFWLLKMILAKKIIIKKTRFDIPILFFFGSQILSTFFSLDSHTSLFGYYGRFNGGLISIAAYILLYYGFVSNLNLEPGIKFVSKLLKVSLISSTIVILWAIPGKFGRDLSCLLFTGQFNNSCWTDQFRPAERMFSTLGQPNWLGAYLAINFFIGLYFLLRSETSKRHSFVFLGYLILNFSSILFTRSRSAFLSVIIGITVLIIFIFWKYKKYYAEQLRKILILLICLYFSIILFKTGISKIDKFLSIASFYKANNSTASVESRSVQQSNSTEISSGITTSSDIRRIVWRGAIDLGLKYPVFGTGVETFAYSYYFVRPQEHNLTSEWDYLYNKAHNEFLNYFATTGFIGFGSYIIMIGIVLFVMLNSFQHLNYKNQIPKSFDITQGKHVRDDKQGNKFYNFQLLILCLLISYLTILITNFFGFSTTTINLFFYLIPAFLVVITAKQQLTIDNQQLSISHLTRSQKIMIFVLLLSTVYFLLSLTKYYLADIKYARGDNYSKLGDYQKAAQLLNEAYNLKYEHVYEDKLSYILANIALMSSYEKENNLAKKMIETSDALNLKSLNAAKQNVLYWKTRAKNYYLFYQINLDGNDLKQAIQALRQAKRISPTDPKIPYSLAIFYSLLEEEAKDANQKLELQRISQQEIDESIYLKANYRDGYFLKGQLLIKAGKKDEARQSFKYILQYLNPNDSEVKKELEAF